MKGEQVLLIDQLALPHKFRYVHCRTYREVADAIKNMIVRGAPAIGVAAAMGLALAALKSKGKDERVMANLEKASNVLRATRPTAVNLQWAIARVMSKAKSARGDDIVSAVVQEAEKMADEDVEVNRKLGSNGAAILDNGDKVLTHCN